MTQTIRLLDDHTINKIAAGEVIENPASVVKELIDNALDAGASIITIDIKQGGRTLIRIQDNGHGMSEENALLSLQRHATSKIREVEDLFSIDTMGFRGEALPSIAAISRFSLHTMKETEGTYLHVEGGKLISIEKRERVQGTVIEIKDLFFNVPVRRKFQRSPAYDANEVLKSVMKLSLANPSIAFELSSDNAVVLKTKAAPNNDPTELLKKRIEEVLGPEFLEEAIPIQMEGSGITLTGFFSQPLASKPNRLSQHLFINRRPVFSPFIAECVRESYGSSLPQGRFPVFVLQIVAPKDLIDINVHPQKKEVRLRHFEQFKSAIGQAVRDALFGKTPSFEVSRSTFAISPFPLEKSRRPEFTIIEDEPPSVEELKFSFAPKSDLSLPIFVPKRVFQLLLVSEEVVLLKGALQKSDENALFTLIDLRSAKETVLYTSIKEKKISELSPFLIPYVFTLALDEAKVLKENLKNLKESGIPIREFGEGSFCLEALPTLFGDIGLDLFIKDLMDALIEAKGTFIQDMLSKKIARAIMRSSSETTIPSHEEIKNLLDMLVALEVPRFSPSGKPIYASLDTLKTKKVIAKNWETLC